MTSRPSTIAPILTVLTVVLAILGLYVGGYFWLGDYHDDDPFGGPATRTYRHLWLATLFHPAARVETWTRGNEIETDFIWEDDPFASDPFE